MFNKRHGEDRLPHVPPTVKGNRPLFAVGTFPIYWREDALWEQRCPSLISLDRFNFFRYNMLISFYGHEGILNQSAEEGFDPTSLRAQRSNLVYVALRLLRRSAPAHELQFMASGIPCNGMGLSQ